MKSDTINPKAFHMDTGMGGWKDSLNIANIAKYRQVSVSIAKYRQVSPSIANNPLVSPSIANNRLVSPSIAKCR